MFETRKEIFTWTTRIMGIITALIVYSVREYSLRTKIILVFTQILAGVSFLQYFNKLLRCPEKRLPTKQSTILRMLAKKSPILWRIWLC